MDNWNSGYVSEIDYTAGYYPELNPYYAKLALLNAGFVPPDVFKTACELGFGQGLSVNIHAASSLTDWWGTDFNPSQAALAKEFANASKSGAQLFDQSFSEFASRKDLPQFDYIGLHGIWSWINDENRHVIVQFIRDHLRVGGVLYVSYNALPGWASFMPMRYLMKYHTDIIGAEGHGIKSRIDGALEFIDKLVETNPLFLQANPILADRLKKVKEHSRQYLAHEYFNRDWHPMHFSTMASWLNDAKVQYACSSNYIEHISAAQFTANQLEFLATIPDQELREDVKDFMLNQQFRKDYWIKGARQISPITKLNKLREEKVVLICQPSDVSLKFQSPIGEVDLASAVYIPLLQILSDHKAKSLGQLEIALAEKNINFFQILQAVIVLVGLAKLLPAQDSGVIEKVKDKAGRLNKHIIEKSQDNSDVSVLACSTTGGGIALSRFQQMFILALSKGQKTAPELAKFVWNLLSLQGQAVSKEGKTLETPEENLAELTDQANVFIEKQLPILKALQIV